MRQRVRRDLAGATRAALGDVGLTGSLQPATNRAGGPEPVPIGGGLLGTPVRPGDPANDAAWLSSRRLQHVGTAGGQSIPGGTRSARVRAAKFSVGATCQNAINSVR